MSFDILNKRVLSESVSIGSSTVGLGQKTLRQQTAEKSGHGFILYTKLKVQPEAGDIAA